MYMAMYVHNYLRIYVCMYICVYRKVVGVKLMVVYSSLYHVIIHFNRNIECLELMIREGCEVNAVDGTGRCVHTIITVHCINPFSLY